MASGSNTSSLKRIMHYCARAERCTQDVLKKLAEWDVQEEDQEIILRQLVNEKFIDEARYANSYVADKWKLDVWGKVKIRNGLYQKGINELLIQKAIETIDDELYMSGLDNLLSKKRDTIRKDVPVNQMKKLIRFGSSRGFEEELIWQWLEKVGLSFEQ